MNLADAPRQISPRPKSVPCDVCGKLVKVKAAGPIPMYCSGAHKQAAFKVKQPKVKVPPKVPLEDRVAARFVQMLIDRNIVVPADMPLPEGER